MKRMIYIAATLLLLASCAKNDEIRETDAPESRSITVIAGNSATRTYMIADFRTETVQFWWQGGDAIKLVEYVSEARSCEIKSSTPLTDDTREASFTVDGFTQTKGTGQKYHYVAVYPASASVEIGAPDWVGTGADAYPVVTLDIPQEQTLSHEPLEGGESFDPAADILVSRPVEADDRPSSLLANFTRMGGILSISLSCDGDMGRGRNQYLSGGSVTVTDDNYHISGPCRYLTAERQFEYVPMESNTSSITFTGGPEYRMSGGGNSTAVMLRCCSGEITGHVSIRLFVNVDENVHEFRKEFDVVSPRSSGSSGSSPAGIVIDDGGITEMSVSLSEHFPVSIENVEPSGYRETEYGDAVYDISAEVSSDVYSPSQLSATVYYIDAGNTEWRPWEACTLEYMEGVLSKPAPIGTDGKIEVVLGTLPELTTYYYCLKVSAPDGKDYYSQVGEFTTVANMVPLTEPSVTITVTEGGFTATWEHVAHASGYECRCYNSAGTYDRILNPSVSGGNGGPIIFTVNASGMEAGTYYLTVTPQPASGYSPCPGITPHEFTIVSGGGGADPVTITLTDVSSGKKDSDWIIYIAGAISGGDFSDHIVEIGIGEGSGLSASALSYSYQTFAYSDNTFEFGDSITGNRTYTVCARVEISGNHIYSDVREITIP